MIELPYPPAILNPNRKAHWAVKGKAFKRYKSDCYYKSFNKKGGLKFKITFHPPDKRRRDRDNIIGAFKAGQDGLAMAWEVDDSLFQITYMPLGEPVKDGKVIIEIIS